MKGKIIEYSDSDVNSAVKKFVTSLFEKKAIDAVLAPKRIPSGESFAYELTRTAQGIDDLDCFPPIMPINGARALKLLTRKGPLELKILCIMRPCEIRASIELSKLHQIDLKGIAFLSMDCPGALETKAYIRDPKQGNTSFMHTITNGISNDLRETCQLCVHFNEKDVPTDLHIAQIGLPDKTLAVIPCSDTGRRCMETATLTPDEDISVRRTKVDERRKSREEKREKTLAAIRERTTGIDNLDAYFSNCINCHNCMRVCPICYCRQCFFDSGDATRIDSEDYLYRTDSKGGITLPADKLLFHLGRMSHMSLSCIGCGTCEDACAMDVPVSQIFIYMATRAQQLFSYLPGCDPKEPIPVLTYQESELNEFEDAKESP